jgi:hypothetical protein
VPTLDPIVSLSVALAEAPGTCAFFLGSGVSRDAGVPTGWEVMRRGLHRLQQLETSSADQIDDDALDAWLKETGREHIGYSEMLELIAPDPAVRREYLASMFEGTKPGPTHEALADLAARGMARVFVTTNFDRLLEHALQARGIEPVVIASDADLDASMPREHATCVVLKPHGDYLRQTIRNTHEELADLDSAITRELGEVFDRYGVVVLGYSGSDEGIGRALRGRRARYGLWWVARGELGQPAGELVEATGGRVITRETAAEFMVDLRARLAVFEAHPSGQTPETVHDETLALMRAGDTIGIDEHLRREGHAYETAIAELVGASLARQPADQEQVREVWHALLPIMERRVASFLPLAIHDGERFAAEVGRLARGLERRPVTGGFPAWTAMPRFAATWLGYVVGALLVRLERFENLGPVLRQTWVDRYGTAEPVVWFPGETQDVFGRAMAEDGARWLSFGWEHLTGSLDSAQWLRERYPELYGENEPRRSMAQFDLLLCMNLGLLQAQRLVAYYSLGSGAAEELAFRLHADTRLRERMAAVMGVSLADFDAKVPDALRSAHGFEGGFSNQGRAAAILEQGAAAL